MTSPCKAGRYLTALQGHKGYVDLTLCRERVLFIEVKAKGGRLSKDQKRWRERLLHAGSEYHCWFPKDWPLVERTLR